MAAVSDNKEEIKVADKFDFPDEKKAKRADTFFYADWEESKIADFVVKKEALSEDWVSIRNDLEKVWEPLSGDDQKEFNSDLQVENCRKIKSRWVFRQTPLLESFFKLGEVLGNPGHYGVVKEGVGKIGEFEGKLVAIKTISKCRYKDDEAVTLTFFEDLRNEVRLMRSSSSSAHPNIINLHAVFEDIKDLHIVMEHCSGGELFDRLESEGVGHKDFNEERASKIVRQLLSSVHHLHKMGIAHCDLKPENFVFDSEKPDACIKLIDFGMAKIVQWRKYHKRMIGTPYYIAPEVLKGSYNEACDIWSLGIIMFIIIFGFPPFYDATADRDRRKSDDVIYRAIRKGFKAKVRPGCGAWFPKEQPVSKECRDLLGRLLKMSTGDRLTSEEALVHPWITGRVVKKRGNLTAPTINPIIRNSLRHFRRNCQLQCEILEMLQNCSYLSRSQLEAVKGAFKGMDLNADGMVTLEELYQSLNKTDSSITIEDCRTIMISIDANKNGVMDYDELLSSRINRKLISKEERLRKVFQILDVDQSKTLTADEIKAAFKSINSNITIEKCNEWIADVDVNKDGVIDYEEWLKIFL